MSPPKSCAVCGDKALGYNFNAVTCESCKAFFRRNALAKKQFTCPFSQNCEITVVTRRFCQKCRLKKCLDIGMKSENIMSEEDKLIKRRKIENNRAKRRLNEKKHEVADSTGFDTASHDSQSSYDSGKGTGSSTGGGGAGASATSTASAQQQSPQPVRSPALLDTLAEVKPEMMSGEEMVEFIVCDPDRASQAISKLMRTPKEAMATLEKIINSQKDALCLISHLIAYPGDALKIISKIMNSPFNALTVFTKFMSSPTDALEIISKVVSSPQDVLQFIKNLMDCPEDALDIMNKFMNTPAEALRIINKIFNGSNQPQRNENVHDLLMNSSSPMENDSPFQTPLELSPQTPIQTQLPSPKTDERDTLIHSMLNNSPHDALRSHQNLTPETPTTPLTNPPSVMVASPLTPSPQAMPLNSPACSVATSDMQYHSPTNMQSEVELPSTSAGLINPNSPTNMIDGATEFANEHFDIKTFIQNSFPENASGGDSLNSLESVLTEVIRIEFQAFNNLPPEPRVKQELLQQQQCAMPPMTSAQQQQHTHLQSDYNACSAQSQHPICAPSNVIMGRDLNETEQTKLRELKLASEALYYPVDDDLQVLMTGDSRIKPEGTHQDPKLLQVINLTAVAIKRLIKMAKKISAFRDMCQEDQVALLKGGCTEMMIMRSAMIYDDDCNTWKIPHSKDTAHIRAEILKLAKGNVYEEHLKFISTFDEKWRMDENIILIMCAIVLFTPTRPRIIHSDVIRLEQNSYYYLLRRYLESVYPGCEAKSAFIKLIQKISDVERLNQFIIGVYLNVNPAQVEPLLREIFDLKNH